MWHDLPSLTALDDDAARWVDAHLPAPCSAAETVRQTARSTVVRLTTDDGLVYFKADHLLSPPEASVVVRLARHVESLVPQVVAVDEAKGWSLTLDAGPTGPTCLDEAPTEVWTAVARAFGRLQCNTGHDPDEWVSIGCRDRRDDRLFEAMQSMIEHALPGLEPADGDALRRLLPRIEEVCTELANDDVPATLVHQDLVPENLVWNAERVVFLDWSDTVVGHPFFGLDRLLDSCWSDADRKAAVIADYLKGFEHVASLEHLQRSFDRILWLRVLYEGLRWHDEIQTLPPTSQQALHLRADQREGLTMVARRQS